MGERVVWSLAVDVDGGPKFSSAQHLQVEAYDRVQVTVPGGSVGAGGSPGKATVEVQPSSDAKDVLLILISSDRYGEHLTVQASGAAPGDGAAMGPEVALEAPLILTGGAVTLLGVAPQSLELSNGLGEDKAAVVTVLVGRRAT